MAIRMVSMAEGRQAGKGTDRQRKRLAAGFVKEQLSNVLTNNQQITVQYSRNHRIPLQQAKTKKPQHKTSYQGSLPPGNDRKQFGQRSKAHDHF